MKALSQKETHFKGELEFKCYFSVVIVMTTSATSANMETITANWIPIKAVQCNGEPCNVFSVQLSLLLLKKS